MRIDNLDNLELGKIYICAYDFESDMLSTVKHLEKLLSKEYKYSDLRLNVEVVTSENRNLVGKVLARKFNIGNIGNYSLLISCCDPYSLSHFVNILFDIKSTKRDSIEMVYNEWSSLERCERRPSVFEYLDIVNPHECKAPKEEIGQDIQSIEPIIDFNDTRIDEETLKSAALVNQEEYEENEAIQETENAKDVCLNKISELVLYYMAQFKEVPPLAEIEKLCEQHLSLEAEKVSSVKIDKDIKVLLTDYNNVEIKLTPLLKTIYILFLLHPEGIVLKEISDYKKEIEKIYGIIKPNRDDDLLEYSLRNLFDVTSGSLMQKISKINKCLQNIIIHAGICDNYRIKGSRGSTYKILLNRDLIKMPKALTE